MPFNYFLTETTALVEKATGKIVYLLPPFGGVPGDTAIRSNCGPKPLHGLNVTEVVEVVSENYRTVGPGHRILNHGVARGPGLPPGIEDGDQFFLYPPEKMLERKAVPANGFSIKGLNVRSGNIHLIPVKHLLPNPQAKANADFDYVSSYPLHAHSFLHRTSPINFPIASSPSPTNRVHDTFTLWGAIKYMTWSPPSGPVTEDPIVFGINHRTKSLGYVRLHCLSTLTASDRSTWHEQNMPVHHFTPPATSSTNLSMSNLAMTGPLLPPPAIDHDFNFESCVERDCKDHDWEIQCNGNSQLMEERRLATQASNAWSGSNVGDQAEMLEAFEDTIGWGRV
ncbi:hypothetical protein B9Z19DRAFT_1108891 [Tuber borchii]|uniref:Uncharacterized protein n=1 Tax=Tuber borchii TaxID=42251 RepID=A0A2T6ZPP1_TUBBO|nr:hypothetical protein B9Z19DRAFT_1108891 [Tuber borchii]